VTIAYRERPPAGEPEGQLVLFHGRGVDENDLFPLLDELDPERRLLGLAPRGPLSLPPGGWHWYAFLEVGFPEPETFLAMFYGADRRRIGLLETLTPLFCQVVKRRFRIRPETVEESREKVRAAFDKLEADVGPSGYLVGESLTVADLTAASILSLIVVPPEFRYIKVHPDERTAQFRRFRDSLKDRPGFKWVEDMYARHRGTSAEVTAA